MLSKCGKWAKLVVVVVVVVVKVMLYVHGKQLRSWDGQLTFPHFPGHVSQRQATSIKHTSFRH